MNLISFQASANDENRTIFKFLVKVLNNIPISKIEKLFRKKDIKLNNKRISDKGIFLKENDLIEIYGISDFRKKTYFSSEINFKINYEDENILIVEKPVNVVIHSENNCLDFQVLSYLKYEQKDSFKPSHVGRIDKGTSGLIIYAKNYKSLVELNKKISFFDKYYLLKSDYQFNKKHLILYYYKDLKTEKIFLDENPKTDWKKMETIFYKEKNIRYAKLLSGKKHQIRLSLMYLGYPIYGDRKYKGKPDKRLYLHSYKIVFKKLNAPLNYLNGQIFISKTKW